MNAVQEKGLTLTSFVKTNSVSGSDGRHKISEKLSAPKDITGNIFPSSKNIPSVDQLPTSALDSSFSEDSKQEILNNILLDLKSGLPEPSTGNFLHLNNSSSIQEAEESAAQSLLLLGSHTESSNNNLIGNNLEWESIEGLLNLHNSTMPPDPPNTEHCLSASSSVLALSKSGSSLRKPETLSIPSSTGPPCATTQCSASTGTNHNLPNGTPEFDIGIGVHELGSILSEIAPGFSHDDFADPDLTAVPSCSVSGCQELELAVRSPTKASNILNSVLSSPPKTTQTPSTSLQENVGAESDIITDLRAKGGFDKVAVPSSQFSEKKSFSIPAHLKSAAGADSGINHSTPKPTPFSEENLQTKSNAPQFFLGRAAVDSEVEKTVEVCGYKLPRILPVDAKEGDAVFVCIFDVFTNFYKRQHWDTFKSILEKFGVTVRSIRTTNSNGFAEMVDVIEVPHLERLLMANTARKDGFVKCLKLSSQSTGALNALGSKIITTEEPLPAELSSGIRTRHGDHSDISYVEWEGKRLCSLLHDGEEYVRLMDIQKNLLSPHSNQVTKSQLQKLKGTCAQLYIDVKKCYNTQKTRMVLYGDSYRSSSLHVITVTDLTKLMAFEKRQQIAKAEARLAELRTAFASQKRSRCGENDGGRVKRKRKRQESLSSSSFYSTDDESSSSSEEEEEGSGSESDDEETSTGTSRPNSAQSSSTSASGRPPSSNDSFADPGLKVLREQLKKNYFLRENGTLIPEEQLAELLSQPVQVPREVNLWKEKEILDRINPVLARDCKPCRVVLSRSAPLKLIVANFLGIRGPVGEYHNHLFVTPHSPCVYCYDCRKLISVGNFVKHSHYISVEEPRIFLHFVDRKRARIDLWKALQTKLMFFRMFNFVYELPEDLCCFYEKRARGEKIPPKKSYSKTSKKTVNNSQLSGESANAWFDSLISEQGSDPVSPNKCGTARAPLVPVKLYPPNHFRKDAWESVLKRYCKRGERGNTNVDPLNFVVGARNREKEIAIGNWYWWNGEDKF